MRKVTAGLLLTTSCAIGAASCAPVIRRHLIPDLPEYRLAILVRFVQDRCRTTTIPALAVVTSRQTVIWEVMSFDPAACKPGDVTLAAKGRAAAPATASPTASRARSDDGKAREFNPTRGEGDRWMVRNLSRGRYQYDVRIGTETEDPELEIWH